MEYKGRGRDSSKNVIDKWSQYTNGFIQSKETKKPQNLDLAKHSIQRYLVWLSIKGYSELGSIQDPRNDPIKYFGW